MPGFGNETFQAALADITCIIDVQEQYNENKGKEYGVTVRLRRPQQAWELGYLHFHYEPNKIANLPPCVGHFKKGHKKTDLQYFDLPQADAYALYFMLMALKPPVKPGWALMYRRITLEMIENLIKTNELQKLTALFRSKIWKLDYWEMEAWSRFINWNAGA